MFGHDVGSQERGINSDLMHNFDFLKVALVFDAAFGPPACCDHNSLKPNLEFFY